MAMLDAISFDVDRTATAMSARFLNVTVDAGATWVAGRHGGFALSSGEGPTTFRLPDVGDKATFFVHFALKVNTPETRTLVSFLDGGTEQVHLRVVAQGTGYQLQLRRDTTVIATSPTYNADTWRSHEIKVTFHQTTGAYELRTDNVTAFSGTNTDTTQTGNNTADQIEFSIEAGAGGSVLLDDILWNDSTGTDNNDFKGDTTVEGRLPNAEGDSLQWTAQGGSTHYTEVDDATEPDDAASYIYAPVNSLKDLFNFEDLLMLGNTIFGVVQVTRHRLSAAGSRNIRAIAKESGTTANGTTVAVTSTSWSDSVQVWEKAPDNNAWSVTKVNAAQFGVESVS